MAVLAGTGGVTVGQCSDQVVVARVAVDHEDPHLITEAFELWPDDSCCVVHPPTPDQQPYAGSEEPQLDHGDRHGEKRTRIDSEQLDDADG